MNEPKNLPNVLKCSVAEELTTKSAGNHSWPVLIVDDTCTHQTKAHKATRSPVGPFLGYQLPEYAYVTQLSAVLSPTKAYHLTPCQSCSSKRSRHFMRFVSPTAEPKAPQTSVFGSSPLLLLMNALIHTCSPAPVGWVSAYLEFFVVEFSSPFPGSYIQSSSPVPSAAANLGAVKHQGS